MCPAPVMQYPNIHKLPLKVPCYWIFGDTPLGIILSSEMLVLWYELLRIWTICVFWVLFAVSCMIWLDVLFSLVNLDM